MKTVLVSFAELSELLKNTTSTEECAGRIEGLKAFKDGTAQKEADIKAAREAQFKAECAVSNAFNKPVVENYDTVSRAIEIGIEKFEKAQSKHQSDAYEAAAEKDNAIPADVLNNKSKCWISEAKDGYIVNYLGSDYELDSFSGADIRKTVLKIIRGY